MSHPRAWVLIWIAAYLATGSGAKAAEPGKEVTEKAAAALAAAEWPQFHGPRRDNKSTETGLLKTWPSGGPKLIWKTKGIGAGFSSVAIAEGMIYITGNIDKKTVITAMNFDGKVLWRTPNGPAYKRDKPGTRSTPTITGGKLFHMNADGDLICLEAKTGKRIWGFNILKKFQGRNVIWALAESPLVDGQKVICRPGGKKIGMVALDKDTGKTIWTCEGIGDKPGYSSSILAEYQGLRQIIALMEKNAVGVAADDGRLLWKFSHKVNYNENILRPVYHDGRVVVSASHGKGTTGLKLNVKGKECSAEKVWKNNKMNNQHGGLVLVDGYVYGHSQSGGWMCFELATGKTTYTSRELRSKSGCLTYADGMLYVMTQDRKVALVPADPKGFKIAGRFTLPKHRFMRSEVRKYSWAHPVVCGGRLYIRYDNNLQVYNVKKPG